MKNAVLKYLAVGVVFAAALCAIVAVNRRSAGFAPTPRAQNTPEPDAAQPEAAQTPEATPSTDTKAPENSGGAEPDGSDAPGADDPQTLTVYRTPSGGKYHISADCPALARASQVVQTTESQASSDGLSACSKCMG